MSERLVLSPLSLKHPQVDALLEPSQSILSERELDQWMISPVDSRGVPSADKWHYLPGTGFNTRLQTAKLVKEFHRQKALGIDTPQSATIALNQVRQDIANFRLEYLLQGQVLPIEYQFSWINNQKRLVGKVYGNQPVYEMISEQERGGAVKRCFAKLEQHLVSANLGDLMVITSPPGPSGIIDGNNREIIYPDTQTGIFKVLPGGEVEAVTIVTDMDYRQNRDLLLSLGIPEQDLSESLDSRKNTAQIVEKVAFLPASKQEMDMKDVVARIQQVKKSAYSFTLRGQDFEGIYLKLSNRRNLLNLDERCEAILKKFEGALTARSELLELVTEENLELLTGSLAKAVLDIKMAVEGKVAYDPILSPPKHFGSPILAAGSSYAAQAQDLRKYAGCNGGGQAVGNVGMVMTPLGPRTVTISSRNESNDCPEIQCRQCGWKPQGHQLSLMEQGLITCCPECEWKPGDLIGSEFKKTGIIEGLDSANGSR